MALLAISSRADGQQPVTSAPPVVIAASCPRLEYDHHRLKENTIVDLAYRLSATGTLISITVLSASVDPVLDAAVQAMLQSCKLFVPAVSDGKAVEGIGRYVYRMSPPGPRPTMTDAKGCAPGANDYPPESLRLNETGTTRIRFAVNAEGKLESASVVKSSGFPRLDEAAISKLRTCTFRAGRTVDGKPTGGTFDVDYVWKLQ